MKMIPTINLAFLLSLISLTSCEKNELSFTEGDISISIETGDHWVHDFPMMLGLTKKNPPQFAIWAEDTSGHYLTTIYATYKVATEGWVFNSGNRRKEALPHWCYQRGIIYDDGLMLPTKEEPLTDGITGATPIDDISLKIRLYYQSPIVIKAEFNHSTDFNSYFPIDAKEGEANYSGGDQGSGQPAIIYAGTLMPGTEDLLLTVIGHSSPDGSDGAIYTDMEKLTTAKSIVKSILVNIIN